MAPGVAPEAIKNMNQTHCYELHWNHKEAWAVPCTVSTKVVTSRVNRFPDPRHPMQHKEFKMLGLAIDFAVIEHKPAWCYKPGFVDGVIVKEQTYGRCDKNYQSFCW